LWPFAKGLGALGAGGLISNLANPENITLLAPAIMAYNGISVADATALASVGDALWPFAKGLGALGAGGLISNLANPENIKLLAPAIKAYNDVNGEKLAITGRGLEAFAPGLAKFGVGGLISKLADPKSIELLAPAIMAYNDVNGEKLKITGEGLKAFGVGLMSLVGGGLLGDIGEFFSGDKKSIFKDTAESLKGLDGVDGNHISKVGGGIKNLADGLNTLNEKKVALLNTIKIPNIMPLAAAEYERIFKELQSDDPATIKKVQGLMRGPVIQNNKLGDRQELLEIAKQTRDILKTLIDDKRAEGQGRPLSSTKVTNSNYNEASTIVHTGGGATPMNEVLLKTISVGSYG